MYDMFVCNIGSEHHLRDIKNPYRIHDCLVLPLLANGRRLLVHRRDENTYTKQPSCKYTFDNATLDILDAPRSKRLLRKDCAAVQDMYKISWIDGYM
jgi:hypothetical protein